MKISKVLLLTIAMALVLIAFSACGAECTHDSAEWRIDKPSTCTLDGEKSLVCNDCGEVLNNGKIGKVGHTVVIDQAVAPDCENAGFTEGSHCSECGDVIVSQTEIPAQHNFDNDTTHIDISSDGSMASLTTSCTACDKTVSDLYTGTYLDGLDAYVFENGHREDIGEQMFAHEGKTYYVVNNKIQVNVVILIDNSVYYFNEDGVLDDKTFDRELIEIKGDAYYVIENNIQLNVLVNINGTVYFFGEDGKMQNKLYTHEEVQCDGATYYVIDNKIQRDIYARIGNKIYYYGTDGKKSTGSLSDIEVTDNNGDTYYVINNKIQVNAYIRVNNSICYYGDDGKKTNAAIPDGEITDNKGNVYYIINNKIQVNVYVLIENEIYYYGTDGKKGQDPLSNIEVTDNKGDTYYVINNKIQVNAYIRVNNSIYYYGADGKKTYATVPNGEITDNKGNVYYIINNRIQVNIYVLIENKICHYGADGEKSDEPIPDGEVTTYNDDVYYVVDNEIQLDVYIRIENKIYYYGEDGKKSTDSLSDREITDSKGDVYYIVNNEIKANVYVLINNELHYYGADGKKSDAPISDGEVTTYNDDVYYVINNEIQVNVYIRIENEIYYYGEDGKKSDDTLNEREITDNKGNVYYIINNEIQINIYVFIKNKICYYGEDGEKSDEPILDGEVTTYNGDVYYVIDNEIQVDVYIRIENKIYYYSDDGKKSNDTLSDREITDNKGDVYYIVNNKIKTNAYVCINNKIYYYGDDGKKSSASLPTGEITDYKGNVYYIINNNIQINTYVRVDDIVYYYGYNGHKSTSVISNKKITDINGNVYYIINNRVQINVYVYIENKIYYFGSNGNILSNGTYDGYNFSADGAIVGSNLYVTVDGHIYEVNGDNAQSHKHNYATTPLASTCISGGYTTYLCECGDSYVDDYTDPLGHNYGTLIPYIEATCYAEGRVAYYECSRCHKLFDTEKELIDAQSLVIGSVYHDFVNNECRFCGLESTTTGGRVFSANSINDASTTISGVTIRLYGFDDKGLEYSVTVTTDSAGNYSFVDIPYGTYDITVNKDGYLTNEATIRVFYANQVQDNLFLIPLSESVEPGSVGGYVVDAQNGSLISGISVYVRKGTNTTVGAVIMQLTTDFSGYYYIAGLEAGNYTLQFVDERGSTDAYADNILSVAILSGASSNQNVTLSRTASEGTIRVVLTWGSTPRDLDSHMNFGLNAMGYHVSYSSKTQDSVSLDVDDTSGYGPETITISEVREGYSYQYYIYNFSGGDSDALANSGARVAIYMGDTLLYSIPVASGSGRYWYVFTYSADTGFVIENSIG